MFSHKPILWTPLIGALLLAGPDLALAAWSQDGESDSGTDGSAPFSAPEAPGTDSAGEQELSSQEEIRQLKEQVSSLWDEIHSMQSEAVEESGVDRTPILYGFFDLTFSKYILPASWDKGPTKSGETGTYNLFRGLINDNSYFVVQQLNLYIFSQLAESTSVISELRFTFHPLGQETQIALKGTADYARTDTTVRDPFDEEHYRLGGVMIERVHLTWAPRDWFGVIAGRYLTPYGIWNIDHGSPVLITIRHPYLHIQEYLPNRQTGLQVFGRVYPTDTLFFFYAITVSNGRGPAESVVDYDEDKGLGLRLKLSYDADPILLEVGGYGYTGEVTDITKELQIKNGDVNVAQKGQAPIDFTTTVTSNYRDYVVSGDLLLELYGVRFQSEVIRGFVKYNDNLRPMRDQMLGSGFQPDYAFFDFYVLAAWTLPITAALGGCKLTPFAMYEFSNQDDSVASPLLTHIFNGGLNFKPSPFIALKLEYSYKWTPLWAKHLADFHVVAAQLAVSF